MERKVDVTVALIVLGVVAVLVLFFSSLIVPSITGEAKGGVKGPTADQSTHCVPGTYVSQDVTSSGNTNRNAAFNRCTMEEVSCTVVLHVTGTLQGYLAQGTFLELPIDAPTLSHIDYVSSTCLEPDGSPYDASWIEEDSTFPYRFTRGTDDSLVIESLFGYDPEAPIQEPTYVGAVTGLSVNGQTGVGLYTASTGQQIMTKNDIDPNDPEIPDDFYCKLDGRLEAGSLTPSTAGATAVDHLLVVTYTTKNLPYLYEGCVQMFKD